MHESRRFWLVRGMLVLTAMLVISGAALAQSAQVEGVINGRSGSTMTLQTQSGNVVVVLTPNTQAEEVQGVFKARTKQMGVTALIPGLPVQVTGSYNAQNQMVAETVKFKGNDLKTAQDLQAGMQPTVQAEKANQQQIQQSEQALAEQKAALQQQQAELTAEQQKIAANKAAIAAANKRFGELGDYNIWDEVTIYFGNGKVTIDPEYKPKLLALAQKASL